MEYFSLPRLYVDHDLDNGLQVLLQDDQLHYLKTVMRRQVNDCVRFFNGRHGEWLGQIVEINKKAIVVDLEKQLHQQPDTSRRVHLFFAPLKKNRMDILIEKAVELGVTDLHPVITNRTDVRKVNEKRACAQILEAAEQCERFSIPQLHDVCDIFQALQHYEGGSCRIYAGLERGQDTMLSDQDLSGDVGFIIGPAGGFDAQEMERLSASEAINPISLGKTVYRAETAAIICLVHAQNNA